MLLIRRPPKTTPTPIKAKKKKEGVVKCVEQSPVDTGTTGNGAKVADSATSQPRDQPKEGTNRHTRPEKKKQNSSCLFLGEVTDKQKHQ
jgi:hypothetical protein